MRSVCEWLCKYKGGWCKWRFQHIIYTLAFFLRVMVFATRSQHFNFTKLSMWSQSVSQSLYFLKPPQWDIYILQNWTKVRQFSSYSWRQPAMETNQLLIYIYSCKSTQQFSGVLAIYIHSLAMQSILVLDLIVKHSMWHCNAIRTTLSFSQHSSCNPVSNSFSLASNIHCLFYLTSSSLPPSLHTLTHNLIASPWCHLARQKARLGCVDAGWSGLLPLQHGKECRQAGGQVNTIATLG